MAPGSKFSRWAIMVGGAAHYIVTSSKTVAYAISSIISRTTYDSGANTDLWSYTCTVPDNMGSSIQASSNCNTQVRVLQLLSVVARRPLLNEV